MDKKTEQTIIDFGKEWKRYQENSGYYASAGLFKDFCGPLLSEKEIHGKQIVEIGSGTGRIVNMLLALGAGHVYAIEPSEAFEVLLKNTQDSHERVTAIQTSGENIPEIQVDLAVSFGVLHHIPQPRSTVDRVYEILKPGGKFIIWLYGQEGNQAYLSLFLPIRKITQKLPDPILAGFSELLNVLISIYILACRVINLPLKDYILSVFAKLDWKTRRLNIFDQLNPAYAKYYTREEAINLLSVSGFKNIKIYHRHDYSWTVIGEKE